MIISKEMKKMNKHEKIKITIWADGNVFCFIEKLLKEKKLNYKVVKSLSAREIEVLRLVTEGKSNTQIGLILKISRHTVKAHLNGIFEKLGVHDRICAAVKAVKENLV